jgi:hypothetical protein
MNIIRLMIRSVLLLALTCVGAESPIQAVANESNASIPLVLQTGFSNWAKVGVGITLDSWSKGGLLEGDSKVTNQSNYFRRLYRTAGNYKSYEVIETKRISQSSEIIYISVNLERAAIYARFLLYRTDKDWVVQNMDFSSKPEAVMPWLAFQGVNYE